MKNCNDLGEKIAARTLAGLIAKASIVEFIWDGEIGTDFDGARYADGLPHRQGSDGAGTTN